MRLKRARKRAPTAHFTRATGLLLSFLALAGSTHLRASEAPLPPVELELVASAFDAPQESEERSPENLSPEAWVEDLETLVDELGVRHADLYANVSKERLLDAARDLRARLDGLDRLQTIAELARWTALIGEGHTGIFPSFLREEQARLPLEIFPAGDGWMILAAPEPLRHIIGTTLERIGDRDIEEIRRAVWPLIPRDNEQGARALFPDYLVLPELLRALGLLHRTDSVPLVVTRGEQEIRLEVTPIAPRVESAMHLIEAPDALPLWLRNRDRPWWLESIPDRQTLYVQFNSADVGRGEPEAEFKRFCDLVVRTVESTGAEKLVIDMRWNDGGNYRRTRHLWQAVIRSERINQPGKIFVIVGPLTYSAAVIQSVMLEQHTNAIFVGSGTGGRPNHSGELRRLRLPNSDLEVRYAAVIHRPSEPMDHRPALLPSLRAEITSEDYRAGRDPALEVIAAYAPGRSLADVLRPIIEQRGVEAARARYLELRDEAYNVYDFGEAALNRLGYELLSEKKPEAAVAIFRLNRDAYPWSANTHDSLGDALRAAGLPELAAESYRKAFALDRRYDHSLQRRREPEASPTN